MFKDHDKIAIARLTALWALNESALGGLMHAFKLPFTGIIVGGVSVLLITLIASCALNKRVALLKALTIVLLVKACVSPYSPVPAYFAVTFQTLLGIFLFSTFSLNKITIILLSSLTFLESALQKLLTLTIIFGETLWKATDLYLSWIGKQLAFIPFTLNSELLMYTFLGTYLVSGLAVGFLIIKTMKLIKLVDVGQFNLEFDEVHPRINFKKKKKNRFYLYIMVLLIILIPILYVNTDALGWQQALYLILRSVLVLIIWYVLLGPLIMKFVNKILSKKLTFYQTDLQDILEILPSLKLIIHYAWKECKSIKGVNKLPQFLANSIVYSLYFNKS